MPEHNFGDGYWRPKPPPAWMNHRYAHILGAMDAAFASRRRWPRGRGKDPYQSVMHIRERIMPYGCRDLGHRELSRLLDHLGVLRNEKGAVSVRSLMMKHGKGVMSGLLSDWEKSLATPVYAINPALPGFDGNDSAVNSDENRQK